MKRFKLSILTVLLLFGYSFHAQQTLKLYGKVAEDVNQKPLQGVSIQVLNSNYGAITNAKGEFSFSIPRKKHVSLVISLLGYNKRVKEIDIKEDEDSVFVMTLLSQRLLFLIPFLFLLI